MSPWRRRMEPDLVMTWNGSVSSWTLKLYRKKPRCQNFTICTFSRDVRTMMGVLIHPQSSQRLLFTRCLLSHHFHHDPLNIISAWGMRVILGSYWDLCVQHLSGAQYSQVGPSRAVWALVTCHQNTVLGFSTMGPGRVLASSGRSSPRHCTLGVTRSQQVELECPQCLSTLIFG